MLRLPRLVDLPHPEYLNEWFFQGKLLWTLKADKHCNLFLFYCNIRYPKSSYQSHTVRQNHLHCWKHRLTTCSSSNSYMSLVGKNGCVRILLSLDLPGPSSNPYKQRAHRPCWYTMLLLHSKGWNQIQELQVRSAPGRGPGLCTPHLAETIQTQSHGTILVLQPKFTSLLTSFSLSLAPGETIALALVTATGIRTTAKVRIFWGNANENNPPVHEKANMFLLLVESSSQRAREPISILLSNKNYSIRNKSMKNIIYFWKHGHWDPAKHTELLYKHITVFDVFVLKWGKLTGIIPIMWSDTSCKTMHSDSKMTFPFQKFTKEPEAQGENGESSTIPLFLMDFLHSL